MDIANTAIKSASEVTINTSENVQTLQKTVSGDPLLQKREEEETLESSHSDRQGIQAEEIGLKLTVENLAPIKFDTEDPTSFWTADLNSCPKFKLVKHLLFMLKAINASKRSNDLQLCARLDFDSLWNFCFELQFALNARPDLCKLLGFKVVPDLQGLQPAIKALKDSCLLPDIDTVSDLCAQLHIKTLPNLDTVSNNCERIHIRIHPEPYEAILKPILQPESAPRGEMAKRALPEPSPLSEVNPNAQHEHHTPTDTAPQIAAGAQTDHDLKSKSDALSDSGLEQDTALPEKIKAQPDTETELSALPKSSEKDELNAQAEPGTTPDLHVNGIGSDMLSSQPDTEPELSAIPRPSEKDEQPEQETETELIVMLKSSGTDEHNAQPEPDKEPELSALLKSSEKDEHNAQSEPDTELELDAMPKSREKEEEYNVQPDPGTEPELSVMPKSSEKDEHDAQPEPDTEPELSTMPKSREKEENNVQPDPDPEPELSVMPKSSEKDEHKAQPDPEPELSAMPKSREKEEHNVQPEPDTEPELSAMPKSREKEEHNVQPDPDTEPELSVMPKSSEKDEHNAQPEPDTEPELSTMPKSKEKEEHNVQPDPDTDPELSVMPKSTEKDEHKAQPDTESELSAMPKSSEKDEHKVQPDTEPELSAMPESSENDEHKAQPDTEPELSALPKPSEKDEHNAQSQPDTEPELSAMPESSEKDEHKAQPDPEPELSAMPKSSEKYEHKAQPDTEPELSAMPESSEKDEHKAQPDTEPELSAMPESSEKDEHKAQPDTEPELSAMPESSEKDEYKAQPDTEPKLSPMPESSEKDEHKAQPDTEPELSALLKPSEKDEHNAQPDTDPELSAMPESSEKDEQGATSEPDSGQSSSEQSDTEESDQEDKIEVEIMMNQRIYGAEMLNSSGCTCTDDDNPDEELTSEMIDSYLKAAKPTYGPASYPETETAVPGSIGLYRAWRSTTAFVNTIVAVSKYTALSPECWMYTARFTCSCPLCVTIASSKGAIYTLANKIILQLLEGDDTHEDGIMLVKALKVYRSPAEPDTTKWKFPQIMDFSAPSAAVILKHLEEFAALSPTTRDIVFRRCACKPAPEQDKLTKDDAVDAFAHILHTYKQEKCPFEVHLVPTREDFAYEVDFIDKYINSYDVPNNVFYRINDLAPINKALRTPDLSLWGKDDCCCSRPTMMNAQDRRDEFRLYLSALISLGRSLTAVGSKAFLNQTWVNNQNYDDAAKRFAPHENVFARCAQMLRLMQENRVASASYRKSSQFGEAKFCQIAAPAFMYVIRSLMDSTCKLSDERVARRVPSYINVCSYTSDSMLVPRLSKYTQWIDRLLPVILEVNLNDVPEDSSRDTIRQAQVDTYNSLVHTFAYFAMFDQYTQAISFRQTILNNLLRQLTGMEPPLPPLPPLIGDGPAPRHRLPGDCEIDDYDVTTLNDSMDPLRARIALLEEQVVHSDTTVLWLEKCLEQDHGLMQTAAGKYMSTRGVNMAELTEMGDITPILPVFRNVAIARRRFGCVRSDANTSKGSIDENLKAICQRLLKSKNIFSELPTAISKPPPAPAGKVKTGSCLPPLNPPFGQKSENVSLPTLNPPFESKSENVSLPTLNPPFESKPENVSLPTLNPLIESKSENVSLPTLNPSIESKSENYMSFANLNASFESKSENVSLPTLNPSIESKSENVSLPTLNPSIESKSENYMSFANLNASFESKYGNLSLTACSPSFDAGGEEFPYSFLFRLPDQNYPGRKLSVQEMSERGFLTPDELNCPKIAAVITLECCQQLRDTVKRAAQMNDGSLAYPMPFNEFIGIEYICNAIECVTTFNHIVFLETDDFREYVKKLEKGIFDMIRHNPEVYTYGTDYLTNDMIIVLIEMHKSLAKHKKQISGVEKRKPLTYQDVRELMITILSSQVRGHVNKTRNRALHNFLAKECNRYFEMVSNTPGLNTYYNAQSTCDNLIKASFNLHHISQILDDRYSHWGGLVGKSEPIPMDVLQVEVNNISNLIYEGILRLLDMPIQQLILKEVAWTQRKVVPNKENTTLKKIFDSSKKVASSQLEATKRENRSTKKKAGSSQKSWKKSGSTRNEKAESPEKETETKSRNEETEFDIDLRPRPRLNVKNIEMLRSFLNIVKYAFNPIKNAIDSIVTEMPYLSSEMRNVMKQIAIPFNDMLWRFADSRMLCAWLLSDPVRGLNSMSQACQLRRKLITRPINLKTPQEYVEYIIGQLGQMSRSYLVELFSTSRISQDWIIVQLQLIHYQNVIYSKLQSVIAEKTNMSLWAMKEINKTTNEMTNKASNGIGSNDNVNAATTQSPMLSEMTEFDADERLSLLKSLRDTTEDLIRMNTENASSKSLGEFLDDDSDMNIGSRYDDAFWPVSLTQEEEIDRTKSLEHEVVKQTVQRQFDETISTGDVINNMIVMLSPEPDFHHELINNDDVLAVLKGFNLNIEDDGSPKSANPSQYRDRFRRELERCGIEECIQMVNQLRAITRQRTDLYNQIMREGIALNAKRVERQRARILQRALKGKSTGAIPKTTRPRSNKMINQRNKNLIEITRKVSGSTLPGKKQTRSTNGDDKPTKEALNELLIDNFATPKAVSSNQRSVSEKRPYSEIADDEDQTSVIEDQVASNGVTTSTCSFVDKKADPSAAKAKPTLKNDSLTIEIAGTAAIPFIDSVVDSSTKKALEPTKVDGTNIKGAERAPNSDRAVEKDNSWTAKVAETAKGNNANTRTCEMAPPSGENKKDNCLHARKTNGSCSKKAGKGRNKKNNKKANAKGKCCDCNDAGVCRTHPTKVIRLEDAIRNVFINEESASRPGRPMRELRDDERADKQNIMQCQAMIAKQKLLQASRDTSVASTGSSSSEPTEDTRDIDDLCQFIEGPDRLYKSTDPKRRGKKVKQRAKRLELTLQHLRLGHLDKLVRVRDELETARMRYDGVCAELIEARAAFAKIKPKQKVKKGRLPADIQIKMDVLAARIGELTQNKINAFKDFKELEESEKAAAHEVDLVESDIIESKRLQGFDVDECVDQIVAERDKMMGTLLDWKTSPRMTRALQELLRTPPNELDKLIIEMNMESMRSAVGVDSSAGTVYNVRRAGTAATLTVVSTPDDPEPEPQPAVPLAEIAQAIKMNAALADTIKMNAALTDNVSNRRPNTARPRHKSVAVLATLLKAQQEAQEALKLKQASMPASQPKPASQPASQRAEAARASTSQLAPVARPPPTQPPTLQWYESSDPDPEPRMRKGNKRQSDKPERAPPAKPPKLTKRQRHLIAKEKAEEEERKRQEQLESERKKALEKKKAAKPAQPSGKGPKGKGQSGKFNVRNLNGKDKPTNERTKSFSYVEPVGPPPKLNGKDKSKKGKHDNDEDWNAPSTSQARGRAGHDQPSTSRVGQDQPSTSRVGQDQPSTSKAGRDQPTRDQASSGKAGRDQPSNSKAGRDQPSTGKAGRDQPSTSKAGRDQLPAAKGSRDQPSTGKAGRDQPSTGKAGRDQPPRPDQAGPAKDRCQIVKKPEVTILPSMPEVRDNQLQITSVSPVRPGAIKPKREIEPKVPENRCSLMEQLSSGVKVADLKLPPGITLTRVPASKCSAQQQSKDALKSVPVWKSDQLPVAPTPLPQPQPVINADPSMMIISPARPEPIFAEPPPLPFPIPSQVSHPVQTDMPRKGKKKKSKKRSGNKNSKPQNENCNGHNVNLYNPIYASTVGVNNNETLKLILNADIPASLHPIPGGMVNIKNATVAHLDQQSLAKIRELAEKATGAINAEPPRPTPIISSYTSISKSYSSAPQKEDITLVSKPTWKPTDTDAAISNTNSGAKLAAHPASIPSATPSKSTATSCPIIVPARIKPILDTPIGASFSVFSTPEELAAKNQELQNINRNATYDETKPFQDDVMTALENDDMIVSHDCTNHFQNGATSCRHNIKFLLKKYGSTGCYDSLVPFYSNATIDRSDGKDGLEGSEPYPITEELGASGKIHASKPAIGIIGHHSRDTSLEDSEPYPMTEQLDLSQKLHATRNDVGIIGHRDTDNKFQNQLQNADMTSPNDCTARLQNDDVNGRHNGTDIFDNQEMTAPKNGTELLRNDDVTCRHVGMELRNEDLNFPNSGTGLLQNGDMTSRHDNTNDLNNDDVTALKNVADFFRNDHMTAPKNVTDFGHNDMTASTNGMDFCQNDYMTAPKNNTDFYQYDKLNSRLNGTNQLDNDDINAPKNGSDFLQKDDVNVVHSHHPSTKNDTALLKKDCTNGADLEQDNDINAPNDGTALGNDDIVNGCHDNTDLLKKYDDSVSALNDGTKRWLQNDVATAPNDGTDLLQNGSLTALNDGMDLLPNDEITAPNNGTNLLQNDDMTAPNDGTDQLQNDVATAPNDGMDQLQKSDMTEPNNATDLLQNDVVTAPNDATDLLRNGSLTAFNDGTDLLQNDVATAPNDGTDLLQNDVVTAPNDATGLLQNNDMTAPNDGTDLLQNDVVTAPNDATGLLQNNDMTAPNDGTDLLQNDVATAPNDGTDLLQNDDMTAPNDGTDLLQNDVVTSPNDGMELLQNDDAIASNDNTEFEDSTSDPKTEGLDIGFMSAKLKDILIRWNTLNGTYIASELRLLGIKASLTLVDGKPVLKLGGNYRTMRICVNTLTACPHIMQNSDVTIHALTNPSIQMQLSDANDRKMMHVLRTLLYHMKIYASKRALRLLNQEIVPVRLLFGIRIENKSITRHLSLMLNRHSQRSAYLSYIIRLCIQSRNSDISYSINRANRRVAFRGIHLPDLDDQVSSNLARIKPQIHDEDEKAQMANNVTIIEVNSPVMLSNHTDVITSKEVQVLDKATKMSNNTPPAQANPPSLTNDAGPVFGAQKLHATIVSHFDSVPRLGETKPYPMTEQLETAKQFHAVTHTIPIIGQHDRDTGLDGSEPYPMTDSMAVEQNDATRHAIGIIGQHLESRKSIKEIDIHSSDVKFPNKLALNEQLVDQEALMSENINAMEIHYRPMLNNDIGAISCNEARVLNYESMLSNQTARIQAKSQSLSNNYAHLMYGSNAQVHRPGSKMSNLSPRAQANSQPLSNDYARVVCGDCAQVYIHGVEMSNLSSQAQANSQPVSNDYARLVCGNGAQVHSPGAEMSNFSPRAQLSSQCLSNDYAHLVYGNGAQVRSPGSEMSNLLPRAQRNSQSLSNDYAHLVYGNIAQVHSPGSESNLSPRAQGYSSSLSNANISPSFSPEAQVVERGIVFPNSLAMHVGLLPAVPKERCIPIHTTETLLQGDGVQTSATHSQISPLNNDINGPRMLAGAAINSPNGFATISPPSRVGHNPAMPAPGLVAHSNIFKADYLQGPDYRQAAEYIQGIDYRQATNYRQGTNFSQATDYRQGPNYRQGADYLQGSSNYGQAPFGKTGGQEIPIIQAARDPIIGYMQSGGALYACSAPTFQQTSTVPNFQPQ